MYLLLTIDNPEEDKFTSLSGDINYYKELHLTFNSSFGLDDKILVNKSYIEKFEEIKKKSSELKVANSLESTSEDFKATWDNSSYVNNIKYCAIPRFLIVEVRSINYRTILSAA